MHDVIDNDFNAPGFSIITGYYLAYASNFAYEQDVGVWADKLGLGNNVEFFTCGQFHGFVGAIGKSVLLAFRGTQSVANCLTDMEASLVSRPQYPGKVHSGFAKAVDEVLPSVQKLLPPSSRTASVWITGHSLGGAMATLTSVRLAKAGYPVRAVYTYGSPRIGDRFFRRNYHLPNYRFVCDNDLVPHLPFKWCYKHVGRPKLMDHQGNFTGEKTAWEAKKRALAAHAKHVQRRHRRKIKAHHNHIGFDWLADHHLERYLDAIGIIVFRASRHTHPHRAHHRPFKRDYPDFHVNENGTVPFWPSHLLRLDSPSPGVPPPMSPRAGQSKLKISDADFIAAFSNQPQNLPWLR
jgi:triacylglycerol lipase